MTRDLLQQATKALSDSGHEQRGARFTRERLIVSLHERRRRSRVRFFVVLPVAAIFVGSTAFAAVTGRLELMVLSALDAVGVAASGPVESPAAPASLVRRPAPSVTPKAPVVHQSSQPQEPSDSQDGVRETAGSVMPAASSPEVSVSSAEAVAKPKVSGAGTAVADDGHAVYRRAHEAQFKRANSSAALQGYDEYLAKNPTGRFSVDARYNRALCLVRLGRSAEARETLEKFADGAYGGYRQGDAERLLEALNELERDGS